MRSVLVYCNDYWHPGVVTWEGLNAIAGEDYRFSYVTTDEELATQRLGDYAALVIARSNNEVKEGDFWLKPGVQVGPAQLRAYAEQGGSIIALHAGASFRESLSAPGEEALALVRAYTQLIGCRFIKHPPQCETRISIVNPEHPAMRDAEDFSVVDEHYLLDMLSDDASVLFETSSATGGEGWPGGYIRPVGKGRVAVLTPGHTAEVFAHPAYQKILKNVLAYCTKQA